MEKELFEELRQIKGLLKTVVWGQQWENAIASSKWLLDKSFSPGCGAVGYAYLYVLYRSLDEVKPSNILELGLGQTTHLISQYATYAKAHHTVIEHNRTWGGLAYPAS